MTLGYVYVITSHHVEGMPLLVWAGTRKWEAVKYLAAQLDKGVALAPFKIERLSNGNGDSISEVNVYEFMEIDLGEQF